MLIRMLILSSLLLFGLVAAVATDIFMRVEGIPGDAQDARHRNEIELNHYEFNFTQTATVAGGRDVGRATMSPFTVTKFTDSSSPRLALAGATGEHLRQVQVVVRQSGREPFEFLRFTLNDVVVSGFTQEHSREGAAPVETLRLSFAVIEMEFTPQRADGGAGTPVRMRWDVRRNAPG